MSERQKRAGDWIASNFSLGNILTIVLLVGGWIVSWATLSAEAKDHERRLNILETNSSAITATFVPRKEYEKADSSNRERERDKDKMLDTRLGNIEAMLREDLGRGRR